MVPLPVILKPYDELNINYQIWFTPHTSEKPFAISKISGNIKVQLFISSDRNKDYELVTTQNYKNEQLLSLQEVATYSSENYEVTALREKFIKKQTPNTRLQPT